MKKHGEENFSKFVFWDAVKFEIPIARADRAYVLAKQKVDAFLVFSLSITDDPIAPPLHGTLRQNFPTVVPLEVPKENALFDRSDQAGIHRCS